MTQTLSVPIKGMSCSHCVNTLEKGLGELPEIQNVKVDLKGKLATVQIRSGSVDQIQAKIKETVQDLGYEVGK